MLSLDGIRMGGKDFEVTKLLYVEDSKADMVLFNESLFSSDYTIDYFTVKIATSLKEAEELLSKHLFHLIVIDIYLPDSDDTTGIERLVGLYPETPIVVMTGRYDKELAYRLMEIGVAEVLQKGTFKKNELARSFINAIRRHEIERKIATAKEELQ